MPSESKPSFNREVQRSTKKKIGQKYMHTEELRSLGIIIKNKDKREIHDEEELTDVLRIIKHSLYHAYKTAYRQNNEHDDNDDNYSNRQVTEANTA